LFSLSLLSLQRMGCCCRARWEDIVITGDAAAWKIPAEDMKGRRSGHVVPLANIPAAVELLKARRKMVPKSCPWVFPAAERDGPVTTYKTAWRRILERAKLWAEDRNRRIRPHDLRRTGGSRMVTAGVPLNVVTRALGDAPSSVSMVAKTYALVVDEAPIDAHRQQRDGLEGGRHRGDEENNADILSALFRSPPPLVTISTTFRSWTPPFGAESSPPGA
jgi:integrase